MAAVIRDRYAPEPPRIKGFYLVLALGLSLLIFVGFARTFYLRTQLGGPPLPSVLVLVHGLLFTSWMLLLAVQSGLARFGRVRWHRGSVSWVWYLLL